MTRAEMLDYILMRFGGKYEGAVWWLPVDKHREWMRPAHHSETISDFTSWFVYTSHPLPDTTDAILAAWDELLPGWTWARWGDGVYLAKRPKQTTGLIEVVETGHTATHIRHDLTRLLYLCLREKEKSDAAKAQAEV